MNKTFIIISIFLFLIVTAGIVYYFYEKPTQIQQERGIQTYDLNFKFLDNGTQIASDYEIYLDNVNNLYKYGTSTSIDYTLEKIPKNTTAMLFNINTNKKYYTSIFILDDRIQNFDSKRLDIDLEKIGNINYTIDGVLGYDNPITLNLTTDATFKLHSVCLRWSSNFIIVSLYNYLIGNIPKRLEGKVDRCYQIGDILTNNTLSVPIYYKVINGLGNNEIKVILVDGDLLKETPQKLLLEDSNFTDTGAKDYEIEIND